MLLQESDNVLQPVAFYSHTLTSSESRCAHLEKEHLASVWACEKFDRSVRGHEDANSVNKSQTSSTFD